MGFQDIFVERDGDLAYLVLNRPRKFNALSRNMMAEMIQALEELRDQNSCRVLIVRAEGRHFCSGHDLSEMVDADTVAYRDIFEQCTRMMALLHEFPQPVIAQVHGIATAAGCQLAASCDLAVAEEGASFGTPGVKIGLFCSTPMVPLVRAVGRKRALEMLLTGRSISAPEALHWGLVNRVVPSTELARQTREMALAIVEASPLTVAIGKEAFYGQVDQDEGAAYDFAKQVMTMNLTTQDAQEGIKAFLEKRTPRWRGR